MASPILDQDRLRQLLRYDPRTGWFTWLITPNGRVPKGSRAGRIHWTGYRDIRINRKWYKASRLAFLYMKGKWSLKNVDHKNGNRTDDRWSNLREATRSQNAANQKRWTTKTRNTPKGVSWHKASGKYMTRIKVNQVSIGLGLFKTKEEAGRAYEAAAKKYFGGFARAK